MSRKAAAVAATADADREIRLELTRFAKSSSRCLDVLKRDRTAPAEAARRILLERLRAARLEIERAIDRPVTRERHSRPVTSIPRGVRLRALHDRSNGRIDARRVARYMGVGMADLARGIGVKYSTLHKTPTAPSAQEALGVLKRSLEILDAMFEELATVRAWLNTAHPELGSRTPLGLIVTGRADVVRDMLESAWSGLPT